MVISAMMKAVYPDAVTELRILSLRMCCVISEQSGFQTRRSQVWILRKLLDICSMDQRHKGRRALDQAELPVFAAPLLVNCELA